MAAIVGINKRSGNEKTGPIPVSTLDQSTCPPTCPLKGNGCYAETGNLGMYWGPLSRGERKHTDWTGYLEWIRSLAAGTLWRHAQAGDMPGGKRSVSVRALRQWTAAVQHTAPIAYSHWNDAASLRAIVATGAPINVSANNPRDLDRIKRHAPDILAVVLVPQDTPERSVSPDGHGIVVCPEQTGRVRNCKECGLCARRNRKVTVGFWPHSQGKRKAEAVARGF